MVADAKIMAAWDRATAPISRYFDLIEGVASGHDEREIARGLRCLDKELSAAGIRSADSALYRPGRPTTFTLVTAMIDDLGRRIAIASDRVAEALQQMQHRLDELNERSSRFAKVG